MSGRIDVIKNLIMATCSGSLAKRQIDYLIAGSVAPCMNYKKCYSWVRAVIYGSVFMPGNVLAIHPDNHQHVTMVAASIYKECVEQSGLTDSLASGMDTIAKSSALEDMSPLVKRYFNWHFFDAYKDDEAHPQKDEDAGIPEEIVQ